MAEAAKQPSIQVRIAPDKLAAELELPAGYDPQAVTPQLCDSLLHQAGVKVTPEVTQAVKQLLSAERPPAEGVRRVVARGQPPTHGKPGRVEWLVDPDANPPPPDPDDPDAEPAADDQPLSFYDQSAFVTVTKGQVLGKLHRPTDGSDGVGVDGQPLPARQGQPAQIKFDDTILLDAQGQLIAQCQGVLHRADRAAKISQCLEVPEYVDFSTGNIDFDGDVIVRCGVRDCFLVKATGSVEVHGLIEAATIETGGDLRALGGFAGRERGKARIGGNLTGKYLDNIEGAVRKDLCIDREVVNCELTVDGAVRCPTGAVLGGTLCVAGPVEVGSLGSGAGVPTVLTVGTIARIAPHLAQLEALAHEAAKTLHELTQEQQKTQERAQRGTITPAERERQTHLIIELRQAAQNHHRAQEALTYVRAVIDQQCVFDVTIHRRLYFGAIIQIGLQRYQVHKDLRGPVRLSFDSNRTPVFERGESRRDGQGLLAQIADLQSAA